MANDTPRATIARWWRGAGGNLAPNADPDDDRERKLERDALTLDLSPDELFAISTSAYYATDLLRLRMGLLHLNAADVAHSDPRLLQSLETSCRLCDVKGRCSDAATTLPKTPLIGDGTTIVLTRGHYVTCTPGKSGRWNDRWGKRTCCKNAT